MPLPFRLLAPLLAAGLALSPAAWASGEAHLYLLDHSLNDVMGGPSLVALGGSITATGYQFATKQGLSLSNVLTDSDYSIDMSFSFSALSAYRRILEFKGLTSDNGLYTRSDAGASTAALNFYRGTSYAPPFVEGAAQVFALDTPARVTLTRDNAGVVAGYVNGVAQFAFNDSTGQALFSGPNAIAYFFQDEHASGVEDPTGTVSYIRIYDTALSGAQVAALAAPVPEADTYALMLLGIGLVGFIARRREPSGKLYANLDR
ncbi:MAG: hypothetical protein B7Y41_03175 [Hydrogenophilales bacterium 28-61-23]|nr:MAG: hypothetical protein B7Y41_03175 [Hydrogenophilales bacterium 28-61-23]